MPRRTLHEQIERRRRPQFQPPHEAGALSAVRGSLERHGSPTTTFVRGTAAGRALLGQPGCLQGGTANDGAYALENTSALRVKARLRHCLAQKSIRRPDI